jgi:carbonic anhydrase
MSDTAPTEFDRLIAGYHRFRDEEWSQQRARWAELAEGQSPKTLVIACSDSRVDPARIFDVSPGELFVVRNIANLVPPFELSKGYHGVSAALEFAVTQLNVAEVVVMGHGACGGVSASLNHAFEGAPRGRGGFIAEWVSLLQNERDQIVAELGQGPEAVRALEYACVRVSLANLRTFPCIPEAEKEGRLKLRGAHFAIAEGVLYLMDEKTGEFAPAA